MSRPSLNSSSLPLPSSEPHPLPAIVTRCFYLHSHPHSICPPHSCQTEGSAQPDHTCHSPLLQKVLIGDALPLCCPTTPQPPSAPVAAPGPPGTCTGPSSPHRPRFCSVCRGERIPKKPKKTDWLQKPMGRRKPHLPVVSEQRETHKGRERGRRAGYCRWRTAETGERGRAGQGNFDIGKSEIGGFPKQAENLKPQRKMTPI